MVSQKKNEFTSFQFEIIFGGIYLTKGGIKVLPT